jgi:hypothetical protein
MAEDVHRGSGERASASPSASASATIAAWAAGEEVAVDRLVGLAQAADGGRRMLDGALEVVPAIRRRALVRRLRELAAERSPEHEALAELADRIEELADNVLVTGEQERLLLAHLLAHGSLRAEQLTPVLAGSPPVSAETIAEWASDAADRGLIEAVEPGTRLHRWQISDRGRAALGVPSAR